MKNFFGERCTLKKKKKFVPNSRSISWFVFINVSETPAISRDVINDPDMTRATSTPRLSVETNTLIIKKMVDTTFFYYYFFIFFIW